MNLNQYLTVKEVLDLHERTIKTHGGASGVRDLGLIESALYRAKSGYYQSLSLQAGALLQSFCMNHAFVDGNKRVAILVTAVFLKLNGYQLKTSTEEVVHFIIDDVIVKRTDLNQIAGWIEKRISKTS